jgi:hypothetical protein
MRFAKEKGNVCDPHSEVFKAPPYCSHVQFTLIHQFYPVKSDSVVFIFAVIVCVKVKVFHSTFSDALLNLLNSSVLIK